MSIVSVDGDLLVYSIGYVCQKSRYCATHKKTKDIVYEDNKTNMKNRLDELKWALKDVDIIKQIKVDPLPNALHSMKLRLEAIRELAKADQMNIYLSGKTNFRKTKVAKFLPYKGSRLTHLEREELKATGKFPYFFTKYPTPGQPKPKLYNELRTYLIDVWDTEVVEWIECDDKLVMEHLIHGKDHVIASYDKDLKQVPGKFLDFRPDEARAKGIKQRVLVSPKQAEMNLWKQVLMGDRSDTIYGIDGIGEKKADELLTYPTRSDCPTFKEIAQDEYKLWFDAMSKSDSLSDINKALISKYKPEEYMQEVHDLVYLLRDETQIPKQVRRKGSGGATKTKDKV